jgi:hypothetical protein
VGFAAFVSAYPWDLIDEGVDAVLDRLHGEVGVTGLALWAGTGPVMQLRTLAVEPRVFRTRGGLFFPPSKTHYEATRCKPVLSTWVKGRNPLSRISQGCTRRGLDLRLIVSAAGAGGLAKRHPEMACKNLFGGESQRSVCLSNPDVQAYLCSLAADLSSNYDPRGLAFTEFALGGSEPWTTCLKPGGPLGDTERSLLSICFCESCHQKASIAGVDVAAASRSAAAVVQKGLDVGSPTDIGVDALLAESVSLGAYLQWQGDELSALLRRAKDACTCELLLDRSSSSLGLHTEGPSVPGAIDWSIPDAAVTRLDDPTELPSARCSGAARNELRLPERFVTDQDGRELVSTLGKAAQLGFAGVQIDNYGLLPRKALTPIKQAIRFARREASV